MAVGGKFATSAERATDTLKSWSDQLRTSLTEALNDGSARKCGIFSLVVSVAFLAGALLFCSRSSSSSPPPPSNQDHHCNDTITKLVHNMTQLQRELKADMEKLHHDNRRIEADLQKLKATQPCIGSASHWNQGRWKDESFVHVKTTSCGFPPNSKPTYFTSLAGTGDDIGSTYGAASIRDPTPMGFTVYTTMIAITLHLIEPTGMIIILSGLLFWTTRMEHRSGPLFEDGSSVIMANRG
ncbi:unknown protein [Seminavis robusta]|uniref:Uncharacterized protein n=1 Tax=Seminavis robusta TaxID=568900 RepID=A0A9N8ECA2_9STRA|nr:unknown protein [Seminavis robusta]|eukprot:Sro796_g203730.1 n/a (240) ;mRNA; r:19729-20448